MSSALLRLSVACVATSALTSAPARAQAVDDRLAECARVAGSSERLACYDALSAARGSSATRDRSRAFAPDATGASQAPGKPTALAPDIVAEFGFDSPRGGGEPQQIQSRYDGEFTGWSGNTLFRLENGQVWKQSQSGRISLRATRPAITIRRSALGAYRMNVEGLKESIRVERVK